MTQVLLVEDDAVLRETTRDALLLEGHGVQACSDGAQALRLLRGFKFDVVVTDLRLPGSSGLGVLESCARLEPPPLAIVITAFGSIQTAVQAMRLGAYDFLTKPFRVEALLEAIAEGLEVRDEAGSVQGARVCATSAVRPLAASLADYERLELHRALRASGGSRTEAARLLGISRKALWEKLKRLG